MFCIKYLATSAWKLTLLSILLPLPTHHTTLSLTKFQKVTSHSGCLSFGDTLTEPEFQKLGCSSLSEKSGHFSMFLVDHTKIEAHKITTHFLRSWSLFLSESICKRLQRLFTLYKLQSSYILCYLFI